MKPQTYTVRIHRENGGYWAEVVELPGCFASGDTEAELTEALGEAVALYLSADGGEPLTGHVVWSGDSDVTERKFLVDA